MELNAATRLKAAAEPLSDEDFKAHTQTVNEYLTDASGVAARMVARTEGEAKVKAKKLEALIDEARHYAFSIR
jgi:hypothetical protein